MWELYCNFSKCGYVGIKDSVFPSLIDKAAIVNLWLKDVVVIAGTVSFVSVKHIIVLKGSKKVNQTTIWETWILFTRYNQTYN